MHECLIGVDIGTQGTKTAVYRSDGVCLADSFEPSVLQHPEPDCTVQNPEEILGSVCRTIRVAVDKAGVRPGDIAAIGMDAQMAGILGVRADGTASTPYDSWLDVRCSPYVTVMKRAAEKEIIESTGGQVTVNHGTKLLWWMHERSEIYAHTACFVTLITYVTMRLCGLTAKEAYIDNTHLHFTGFADNTACRWNEALLHEFKVEYGKLPRICRPTELVGGLTASMAQACGLLPGTPVAAGCGDSAASSLGAGIVRPGQVYDVAGTASIFSCTTSVYTPDTQEKNMLMTRSAVDGLWNALAYISGGGMCLRWFKGLIGRDYTELDTLAGTAPPGSGGLLFIPHFAGRTCPHAPALRGTWLGLDWQKDTSALYRSIMESIAYEYRLYLYVLQSLNKHILPQAVYGVGGGSRSQLFNQIKADVLELPYHSLSCGDTAAWGSARIAGVACGLFPSLSETVARPNVAAIALPQEQNRAVYRRMSKRYIAALQPQTAIYETIERKGR